jgi:hypothetical protein
MLLIVIGTSSIPPFSNLHQNIRYQRQSSYLIQPTIEIFEAKRKEVLPYQI